MAMEQLHNISVTEPITPAIERVKIMLFNPFDLGKWFVVGFCVWLAELGKGSGGVFNIPFDVFKQNHTWHHNDFGSSFGNFHQAAAWFTPVIIAVIIIFAIIGIAIGIVCLWLSSRGKFMFLHCVVTNKAEVAIPWHKYKQQGNSLFVFRLVVGIIAIVAIAVIAGIITALGFLMYYNAAPIWAMVISLIFIGLLTLLPATIAIAIFFKFTNDFVIPIMFLRAKTAVEAWREFFGMLSTHKGKFILYILFQIVIAITIGAIVFAAVLVSCCGCCTVCIWFVPYISTVILLPVLIFKLAYSLNYLRQFGIAYDVFAVSE
jgi:hypothetical protein